jgi:catechol-2,3-dioxygenase
MNISFNRVILFVRDVEALKNFYQKNFGFEVSEETRDQWVVLKTRNGEIALHKAGAMFSGNNDGANNNAKLVFETDTNLYQLREELVNNNVAMREIQSFGDSPDLYCDGVDIEGNVFQLMQRVG